MLQAAASLRAPAPFCSPQAAGSGQQQRAQRRLVAVRAEQQPEQQPAASAAPEAPKPAADTCATCGVPLSQKPFGCDGAGRINGGIGAVPGFRWWPIKAYRPCPKASAAGIRYERKGQITDEVLFGKGRQ